MSTPLGVGEGDGVGDLSGRDVVECVEVERDGAAVMDRSGGLGDELAGEASAAMGRGGDDGDLVAWSSWRLIPTAAA